MAAYKKKKDKAAKAKVMAAYRAKKEKAAKSKVMEAYREKQRLAKGGEVELKEEDVAEAGDDEADKAAKK